MIKQSWILLALLCAGCASTAPTPPAGAQLVAPADRITDEAVQADQDSFAAVQARIQALNDRGDTRVASYALAKAQCWLDVSFHEYSRNDRSDFPEQALGQSVAIVSALEQHRAPGTDTPLVNGAARLREDLWSRAAALRQGAGARCAEAMAACAEVELVHAGNEYNQQGWRHAKPYVQIAEDQVAQGGVAYEQCGQSAPVAVAAPRPSRTIAVNLLFAFDRYDAASIVPATRAEFDALAQQLRGARVERARVVGNADRLNGTGNPRYNDDLALKRAETVTTLLVEAGVGRGALKIEGRGDDEPVVECKGPFASESAREACLLANRRVRVEVTFVPAGD